MSVQAAACRWRWVSKGSENLLGVHVTPVGNDFASRSSRPGPLSVDPSRLQRCDLTLCRLPREPLVLLIVAQASTTGC